MKHRASRMDMKAERFTAVEALMRSNEVRSHTKSLLPQAVGRTAVFFSRRRLVNEA